MSLAPSSIPLLMYPTHAVALDGGDERPDQLARFEGVARSEAGGAADAISSTSASRSRGTSMRVRAEQVWPEFM